MREVYEKFIFLILVTVSVLVLSYSMFAQTDQKLVIFNPLELLIFLSIVSKKFSSKNTISQIQYLAREKQLSGSNNFIAGVFWVGYLKKFWRIECHITVMDYPIWRGFRAQFFIDIGYRGAECVCVATRAGTPAYWRAGAILCAL